MLRSSFRWAAAVAAVLVVGFVLAHWIVRINAPQPEIGVAYLIEPSLIDDGRIGKVTDTQGIVGIKPVLHERWSPGATEGWSSSPATGCAPMLAARMPSP